MSCTEGTVYINLNMYACISTVITYAYLFMHISKVLVSSFGLKKQETISCFSTNKSKPEFYVRMVPWYLVPAS